MIEELGDSKQISKLQQDYQSLPNKVWIKAIGLTLGFLFILIFTSILALGSVIFYKTNQFRTAAKLSWSDLEQLGKASLSRQVMSDNGRKNILLLGVDELENREGHPVFTDTIAILSIDLTSGKIYTLPIPRDVWSEEYQTKINALYIYGQDRYPGEAELFTQEVISELTGIKIHHNLVLSLDQLAQIIDLIGGVEVEIKESFTDNEFPRSDADISSSNKAELYETVSFEKGLEKMSGQRALKYIRSRHSESNEGSDLARSQRQQQVISALISQLSSFKTIKNTQVLGKLYLFYQNNFDKYLDSTELAATVKKLIPHRNNLEFLGSSLSIYPDDENGVLTHPDTSNYDGQWVYIIKDRTRFQVEVKEKLNL